MKAKHFNLIIVIFGVWLLSACSGLNPRGIVDGTIHAIILADTDDSSIGKSTGVDLQRMTKIAKSISKYTGLKLNGHKISGEQLTYDGVMTILENLPVKDNDVVFFYYAGHGSNPGQGDKWPMMRLKDHDLLLSTVFEEIQQKAPRLFLVIADTCNKASAGRRSMVYNTRIPENQQRKLHNYQELFLNYSGSIIASGSKPGQFSWSNSQFGGFFTSQFEASLHNGLASNRPPSWKTIMRHATQTISPGGNTQNPQAEVKVSGGFGGENSEGVNDLKFEWLLDQSPERNIEELPWN